MQPAARRMMPNRMLGMTAKIQRRMRRRIGPLARLLGTLDVALVDRRIKYALALLRPILRMHRAADLLALGCQWHRRVPSCNHANKTRATPTQNSPNHPRADAASIHHLALIAKRNDRNAWPRRLG